MKAVEFEAKMSQRGEITLPAECLADISPGEQLRVVVMWEAGSVNSAWRATGRRKFEEAYCPEDSVYEQLIHDAPSQ